MTLKKKGYKPRLIDAKIEKYLRLFGAVSIVGPKWCGKTWSAYSFANSATLIADPENDHYNRRMAIIDPASLFKGKKPQLIDEWQDVPGIWDAVRYSIDDSGEKGMFILTGSATPNRSGYVHSGTGRIKNLEMTTMTLFERGLSAGQVSLMDLFEKKDFAMHIGDVKLKDVIEYTIHGGWPGTMGMDSSDSLEVARGYIETMATEDICFDGISRNPSTMNRLIRSLGRNESTVVSKSTLRRDMVENPDDAEISENTLDDYLSVLERLHFTSFIPAFNPNMRSSVRVGKTPKRHLTDPSLAAASLGTCAEACLKDLNTFGFLFESLCAHDLKVYSAVHDASVFHYRDGDGREIDIVVEMPDGRWGAFEVKVGAHEIDNAANSLLRIDKKIREQEHGRAPEFLCVLCAITSAAYRRPDGVYVLPPTALGP